MCKGSAFFFKKDDTNCIFFASKCKVFKRCYGTIEKEEEISVDFSGCKSDYFDIVLPDETHSAETVRRVTLADGHFTVKLAPNSVLMIKSVN